MVIVKVVKRMHPAGQVALPVFLVSAKMGIFLVAGRPGSHQMAAPLWWSKLRPEVMRRDCPSRERVRP